ncbi:MAG TPA: Clp protease N-terminal domain-containing protein [Armatimonadota bacterium]|nr:Clp protease N-terminal domain-containing protein [Armatimonadota bacterium]
MSMLWQRFTERAKRVVIAAQEEAANAGEPYVTPEHLLLGLVKETDSVATRVLERLGVPAERARREMERQIGGKGYGRLNNNDVTLDSRMKRVLDFAYDEARQSSTNYIGTEHLLLGVIREGDGIAFRTLAKLGIDIISARKEVVSYLGGAVGTQPARRLGYEVRKFSDPVEAGAWLNSMIAQGFTLTYSSTSDGELWLIVEGLISSPEPQGEPSPDLAAQRKTRPRARGPKAPKAAEPAGDTEAAKNQEEPDGGEGQEDSS